MSMVIRFPFPDMKLSPNARGDRRWLSSERKAAKTLGFYFVKDAGLSFPHGSQLQLTITICPPDRIRRDDDNIYSAFKSSRDGMFQALGMDDSAIRRTILQWGDVEKGGALYVELIAMSAADLQRDNKIKMQPERQNEELMLYG